MGQQIPNIPWSNTLISENAMINAEGFEQPLPITRVFEKSVNKKGKQKLLWRVDAFFIDTFFFKISICFKKIQLYAST